jgi:uncharacterized damage-inducible protein DinB
VPSALSSCHPQFMAAGTGGWLRRIAARSVRSLPEGPYLVEGLIDRLTLAAKELADVSRRVRDEGRLDEMYADPGEEPPIPRPFGGMIVHVITHSMHHRARTQEISAVCCA